MKRTDVLIFSMPMAWKRSERSGDRDWFRADTRRYRSVLARFLEENDLLTRKVTNAEGLVEWDLELWEKDLTPAGVALSWGLHIDAWLRSIDRGTPPENTRRLRKGLDEIRRIGVHEALKKTNFYKHNDPDVFLEYSKPN